MQTKALCTCIQRTDARLKKAYGEPHRDRGDAVSQLVGTMLSQATTDVQTARSFDELRRRFPTWDEVSAAPVREIASAIRSSGLSKQKAPRIKAALQYIRKMRGTIELEFLERLPPAEARQWLMQINGVGPKTASIVLLFTFGLPFFPVDTHILRVTKRLGWIPPTASAERAHDLLAELVPPRLYFRLHLNLIEHGRAICRAGKPRCEVCPLTDFCVYYATVYKRNK